MLPPVLGAVLVWPPTVGAPAGLVVMGDISARTSYTFSGAQPSHNVSFWLLETAGEAVLLLSLSLTGEGDYSSSFHLETTSSSESRRWLTQDIFWVRV